MDFNLSPEQEMILASVEKFTLKNYSFENRRKWANSNPSYSKENWKMFADLGWLSIPFSEDNGGFGGSAVDLMILLEPFGEALVTEPYIPNIILCGRLIECLGDAEQKEQHLTALIAGELQLGLAHTEEHAGNCLSFVDCRAEKEGSEFIINGTKMMVLNGHQADMLLVSARTHGENRDHQGIELFLIDINTPGIKVTTFHTIDGLRAANIKFDRVRVPSNRRLGASTSHYEAIEAVTDEAILAVGAEAVGGMKALCEITVNFTKERKQFGVPISKFQVLQHYMVDMLIAYEEAKSLLYKATLTAQEGGNAAKRSASALKVKIGKSGKKISELAVQLHGGMGTSDELNVGYYFKRMLMVEQLFGNSNYHLDRFIELGN